MSAEMTAAKSAILMALKMADLKGTDLAGQMDAGSVVLMDIWTAAH